ILQCELHDSWSVRTPDLAERTLIESRGGISGPEAIRQVVRLGSKLQSLGFTESEYPRQSRIKLPGCGALNNVPAQIAACAQGWQTSAFPRPRSNSAGAARPCHNCCGPTAGYCYPGKFR